MLGQQYSIQQFSISALSDILDYKKHIRLDPRRESTADAAYCEISTEFNRYLIAMGSAYATPPAGASNECRQLGWIDFHDPAADFRVLEPKGDRAFAQINEHMHRREIKDAIANTTRKLAEAGPADASLLRIRLGDLVERGQRWGINAKLPDEPTSAPPIEPPSLPPLATAPTMSAALPAPPPAPQLVLDGEPFVGASVVLFLNPGERIGGLSEIPGIISNVHTNGRVDLLVIVADSETIHRVNVPRRGTDAGDGRVHLHNAWDFNPAYLRDQARLRALEASLAAIEALAAENKHLSGRIAALESATAKSRRGRPAKPESGGEAEGVELAGETEPAAKEPDLIGE